MSKTVTLERDGHVLVITIRRPEMRNAIDRATSEAIAQAMDELDGDNNLTVGILTGAGAHFCSGMDLKAFLRGERVELPGRGLAGIIETPPRKPVIAAVEGYALAGGFEIALACDLMVAADNAQFGLPEVKRGLMAGSGGLMRLPERIPRQIAMQYALTGEMMSAVEARQWGLVNQLTAPGEAVVDASGCAAAPCRSQQMVRVKMKRKASFPLSSAAWGRLRMRPMTRPTVEKTARAGPKT